VVWLHAATPVLIKKIYTNLYFINLAASSTRFIHAKVVSPVITPSQCRAARGLLEWSQQDLATTAGVSQVTVHQLEAGSTQPRRATLDVIRRAFENAGVEFIDENGGGPGVRLRKPAKEKPRK
jgi:DNA-binding XRE family transcriptional regulator